MTQDKQQQRKSMRRPLGLCQLLLAILFMLVTPIANSQSYSTAHTMYQKGNFKGAELALKKALNTQLPKSEQAKIYKLLGICQFMLNNKAAAASSFKQALSAQANLQIAPSEVLDEAVIAFFNAQRRPSTAAAGSAPKLVNRQQGGGAAAPASPNKPANRPIAGAKVVKSTFLKVLSNVPSASISIDGILAGQANNLINTDPGQIEIEVSAAGYPSKTLKVNIIRNRENTVTVNLEKPKPKPKPQPKPAPAAVANAPASKSASAKKRKARDDDLFAPAPDVAMFPEEKPAAPGQRPAAPAAPAGDPTAEFAMDAATGGAAAYAPPPGFAQPAAPGYAAPPVYYTPPPSYYSPPPPPPAPSMNPGLGQGGYEGGLPPDPAGSAGASPANRRAAQVPRKRFLLTIAPFGGGQFQNRDYVMGGAVAAAQLYTVWKYLSLTKQADTEVVQTNNYIVAAGGAQNLDDNQKQYVNKMRARVNTTRKQADLYGKITGALYIAGVIDAFTNDPPPVTKKKTPKRRRFQPLMTATGDTQALNSAEAAAIEQERQPSSQTTWSLGLTRSTSMALPSSDLALDTTTSALNAAALLSDQDQLQDALTPSELGIHVKLNWRF